MAKEFKVGEYARYTGVGRYKDKNVLGEIKKISFTYESLVRFTDSNTLFFKFYWTPINSYELTKLQKVIYDI